MVPVTVFAVSAALWHCQSALGAPATEAINLPNPSTLKNPLGFDPDVASGKSNRLFSHQPPEIIDINIAGLQGGNFTEFLPSHVGPLEKRDIIGADNRVLWTNREYPYSAMGRIMHDNGIFCSASMIGPRHVAAARHCIQDNSPARFQPAYDNGEVLGGSQIIRVWRPDYGQEGWCANAYDWAIFIIADRLGEASKYGHLGLKVVNPDTQLNRAMFFHYGYPGDKGGVRPYRQEAISASAASYCERGSPVVTDADAIAGQSGGPLWINENGNRFLYGVMGGGNADISVFAGGSSMLEGYSIVLKDYP